MEAEQEKPYRTSLRQLIRESTPLKKSEFSHRVRDFMIAGGQPVRDYPGDPGKDVRLLAARLLIEEALECVQALGVDIVRDGNRVDPQEVIGSLCVTGDADIVGVTDGACDTIFVSYWAMNALGISDYLPMLEVCDSNDRKFGPGSYKDENGKIRKPAGWVGPDIESAIAAQIAAEEE